MSDKPNLNTGTPWSKLADRDLRWCVEHGQSIAEIADCLCRTKSEVRHRMHDLGLQEPHEAS